MGHIRLPRLPRAQRWEEVVGLLTGGGGSPAALASATLDALDEGFLAGTDDPGLVQTVWLLARLPDAARSDDFGAALRELDVDVSDSPSVTELAAGISRALDRFLDRQRARSDLGEMAVAAAVETLASSLARSTPGLFPHPDDTRQAVAKLGTEVQFGRVGRDFFARFADRCLTFYVDRSLPTNVAASSPVQSLEDRREFMHSVELHCREAARIVESFAGGWWSKARFERDLSRERTARFVNYSLRKLSDELRRCSE